MDETPDGGAKRDSLHEAPPPWRAADGKRTGRDPSSSRSSDAATRKPSSSRRLVERGLGRRQECGKGANFFIESRSFPRSEGCYKPLSQYNGEAMYRQARKCESCNYVVGATQGDNKNPDEVSYRVSVVGIFFPPSRDPAKEGKYIYGKPQSLRVRDHGMKGIIICGASHSPFDAPGIYGKTTQYRRSMARVQKRDTRVRDLKSLRIVFPPTFDHEDMYEIW